MVDFAPPLAFVAPPPPMLPPVGVPFILPPGPAAPPPPSELPPFLRPFPLPFLPEPPPVPLQPVAPGPLPLPRDLFEPGPEVVPEIPPPFQGGQCPGVLYRVDVTYVDFFGVTRSTFTQGFMGPVVGLSPQPVNEFGNVFVNLVSGAGDSSSLKPFFATSPANVGSAVLTVSRDGGLPDTCGNPPPVQEEERLPNPSRNFVPSPLFVPDPAFPIPVVLPEVDPRPKIPPFIEPEPPPEEQPEPPPDRRVPGPPLPIQPITPPEVVPFEPGTIPDLPTVPDLDPPRLPPFAPPGIPRTPPPVTDPPRLPPPVIDPPRLPPPPFTPPPQFPPLPPEVPTRTPVPPPEEEPVRIPIPPLINIDCCAVPEVIRQGEAIRRRIDELEVGGDCVDLCDPAIMVELECQGGFGFPVVTSFREVTVSSLAGALGLLSRQVQEIIQFLDVCKPPVPDIGCCPPPGDVGEPVELVFTGLSGNASGVVPEGHVLTGLRVDLVEVPGSAREYSTGVYRGVGFFYMGTAAGLDQDYAGSMVRDGQFIFPEQCNLTHWAVTANSGYNIALTPYSRSVLI